MKAHSIRKQKYIQEDDPRYRTGNGIENRIEAPPAEVLGDAFDRQRCIVGWNQRSVEDSRCLVLGAGGIGQDVGMVLARVGVGKISFVDKDLYEASNLTRQLLGSASNVGKRKVDVAIQNIAFHSLRADAVYNGHHLNALESWQSIVALAKDSTVIFNCIDDSTGFDFAVNSLSKSLGIPVIQGQSAAWSFNAEFYSGASGKRCFACSENLKSSFCIEGSAYEAIENRLLSWLHLKENGTSAEGIAVLQSWLQNSSQGSLLSGPTAISSAVFDFLAHDRQYRISGETAKWVVGCALQRTLCDSSSACNNSSSDPQLSGLWKFKQLLRHYHDVSMSLLMPGSVEFLDDIAFIPRPKGLPTRYFGSWVCPCLAVATLMVSQYVNSITGPTNRDPPCSIQFSLASGRTDLCEAAVECGFVDRPTQSGDESSPDCRTCREALKMTSTGTGSVLQSYSATEEQLFYSMAPVALRKCSGRVLQSLDPLTIKEQEAAGAYIIEMRSGRLWCNIDNLGPAYSNLALDAVPCRNFSIDWAKLPLDSQSLGSGMATAGWPDALQFPLMKSKWSRSLNSIVLGEPDFVTAFSSGVRSALLPSSGEDLSSGYRRWFRLKGCGVPGVGVTVEDAIDDEGRPLTLEQLGSTTPMALRKIRGASYVHTSTIELHMTARVNEILSQYGRGMKTANSPLGRWDYACPCPTQTACNCEYPLITRSCALFETHGDRRLGDHLLRGLELLLPMVFSLSDAERVRDTIMHGLVSQTSTESIDREKNENIENWDEFDERLPRTQLLFNGGANSPPAIFLDLLQPALRSSLSVRDADDTLPALKEHFPSKAPKALRAVWDRCCDQLAEFSSSGHGIPKLFATVYWRLGRECGFFGRLLREHGVIWGSFRDATGSHMNAHANNFVVMPENLARSGSFLAPLDFDMAFTRETRSELVDDSAFEELGAQEFSELGFNLAMVQSSQPSTSTGTKAPTAVPEELGLYRMALRSTLTKGWLTAAQGLDDEHTLSASNSGVEKRVGDDSLNSDISEDTFASIYALIKLALILTWDIIA